VSNPSDNATECALEAERCRANAEAARDAHMREVWLDLEQCWLQVASSYAEQERLGKVLHRTQ